MKMGLAKFALYALLTTPLGAIAAPVTVGDKEWMQPVETVGYTWNEVSAVCDPTSGVCGPTLLSGTVDLSGWIWASITDVLPLLYALTPLASPDTEITLGPDTDTAFASLFEITADPTTDSLFVNNIFDYYVAGYIRDQDPTTLLHGDCSVRSGVSVDTNSGCGLGYRDPDATSIRNGHWFYRAVAEQPEPTEVPEPTTLALLGLGLAGMGFARRRRMTTKL